MLQMLLTIHRSQRNLDPGLFQLVIQISNLGFGPEGKIVVF